MTLYPQIVWMFMTLQPTAGSRWRPTARFVHSAAVLDGKIYVTGGGLVQDDFPGDLSDALDTYDPVTDTWTTREFQLIFLLRYSCLLNNQQHLREQIRTT